MHTICLGASGKHSENVTTCDQVSLVGLCGEHCPMLHNGECEDEADILAAVLNDISIEGFFKDFRGCQIDFSGIV